MESDVKRIKEKAKEKIKDHNFIDKIRDKIKKLRGQDPNTYPLF